MSGYLIIAGMGGGLVLAALFYFMGRKAQKLKQKERRLNAVLKIKKAHKDYLNSLIGK